MVRKKKKKKHIQNKRVTTSHLEAMMCSTCLLAISTAKLKCKLTSAVELNFMAPIAFIEFRAVAIAPPLKGRQLQESHVATSPKNLCCSLWHSGCVLTIFW